MLELRGASGLPELVGMHATCLYRANLDEDRAVEAPPLLLPEMMFSASRLYLAGG